MLLTTNVCLKDSQEFLLFLLNELHEELKQLQSTDACGWHACATDSGVDQSLSDADCISTRGIDVLSDDESSCHSSTSVDNAFYVRAPVSPLLTFLAVLHFALFSVL